MNSLPKTVTRQRRDCDLSPGPSAPESSMLTTRLPSHLPPTGRENVISVTTANVTLSGNPVNIAVGSNP